MKTLVFDRKMNRDAKVFWVLLALFISWGSVSSQEKDSIRTLFKPGVKVTELWTPEVKINSIQGNVGTLVGFYGGALINRTFLIGIAGGVNLSHPEVNYGYFGGIGQVIFFPEEVVHFSGQLMLAHATTKDYENPKSGLLDNFWNISGEQFFILEPGLNLEMNLSARLILVTGVTYRFASGIDSSNENVAKTRVTDRDMSGLNFSIGLKFGKQKKAK